MLVRTNVLRRSKTCTKGDRRLVVALFLFPFSCPEIPLPTPTQCTRTAGRGLKRLFRPSVQKRGLPSNQHFRGVALLRCTPREQQQYNLKKLPHIVLVLALYFKTSFLTYTCLQTTIVWLLLHLKRLEMVEEIKLKATQQIYIKNFLQKCGSGKSVLVKHGAFANNNNNSLNVAVKFLELLPALIFYVHRLRSAIYCLLRNHLSISIDSGFICVQI